MKRAIFSFVASALLSSPVLADSSIAPVEEQYAHVVIFNPGEKALPCPSADTMMNARTAIFAGDLNQIISATEGEACLLGEAGSWGMIIAAHRNNYADLFFS